MRNARFTGWGAAALAAVLVTTAVPAAALPLDESASPAPVESAAPEQTATPEPTTSAAPTEAPEPAVTEAPVSEAFTKRAARAAVAAAAVGDLAVTVFDDRYADGIFDTAKGSGDKVDRADRGARLLTSDGVWHEGNPGADGVVRFEDVPVGVAQIHVTYPNGPGSEAFFDATDATSADDIERLPSGSYQGTPTAVATVTIDEDGEAREIGLTGLRAVADVNLPDGTPARGVKVELGSAGQWYSATEYDFSSGYGTYEAFRAEGGYQIHLPDELGLRLTAPAGYKVGGVTAISGGGNTTDVIPVTERDGSYWIAATDAASFFFNPTFIVALEELPKADLRVTAFDDRYADGVFDVTKGSGSKVDELSTRLSRIVTSQGIVIYPGIDDKGEYLFEDVPLGETKVYFTHPNASLSSVFFDATDAEPADDITRIPNESLDWSAPAVATVTVDTDGADLVAGFTALRAVADVEYADGTPASDLEVELGSAGQWYDATEYDFAGGEGQYEAIANSYTVVHLPDEIGVRVSAPQGFEIGEVTAISGGGNTTDFIPVTERDGSYWIDTADASSYFSNPTFEVTLEELPTTSVDVTYFADVELDGSYDADADLPIAALLPGTAVYLQDAAGEWWATTAGEGGQFSFTGVAPGAAKIYAEIPEIPESPQIPELPELEIPEATLSLWDATDLESYRDTVRAETDTISFEGTLINPDGTTDPIIVTDKLVGLVEADLAEPQAETRAASQQVLIGAASVFQAAAVVGATGEPVEGVEVEFLSNAEPVEGTEIDEVPGLFLATEEDGEFAVFGAAEYGIVPTAPEGYEVVAVTAISGLDGELLDVTGGPGAITVPDGLSLLAAADDEYRVDPTQVGGPANAVVWAVVVAPTELPPVDPGTLPGTDVDPGAGLPAAGPAAGPRVLPATGSDSDPLVWMLGAGLLIAAGLSTRVLVRRRNN